MAHPQLAGRKRQSDSVLEAETAQKKHCVQSENQQPDFSLLPDKPWIMIMSNLQERDRLALVVTCKRLSNICKTASILWRSAALHIGSRKRKGQVNLTSTEICLLQSHSHQIQDMEFVIYGLRGLMFSETSFLVLKQSAARWPLKNMAIHDPSRKEKVINADKGIVKNVSELIINCLTSERSRGLEKLVISKCLWAYGDKGSVILEALKVSSFTDSLKELTLGPVRVTQNISDLSHTIPHVAECVGRFQNLQRLQLCSYYLSDQLLETISSSMTTQFQQLIFFDKFVSLPEKITKWPQLLSTYPDLTVDLFVEHEVNCEAILEAFPSIVPVQYVEIGGFTDTSENDSRKDLLNLLPSYRRTLTEVIWDDFSEGNFDSAVVSAVRRCPQLRKLCFKGSISSTCISTLVSMREWWELEFMESSITFPESNSETQAEQMSRLKTAVYSRQGNRCVFVPDECDTDSEDLDQPSRPIRFTFKCESVIR